MLFRSGLMLAAVSVGFIIALSQSRPSRAIPFSVTFAGYTNDPWVDPRGDFSFAIFRITNGARCVVACRQGPVEVKFPAGWVTNNPTHSYYSPSLESGKGMQIIVPVPATNMVWRANFIFQESVLFSYWRYKVTTFFHLRSSAFQTKPKTWNVRTDDLVY